MRERVVKLAKASTNTNVADIHTKPLDAARYFMLMAMLPFRVSSSGCTTAHAIVVSSMCMQLVEGEKSTALTSYMYGKDNSAVSWNAMVIITVFSLVTATVLLMHHFCPCARRKKHTSQWTQTEKLNVVGYWELSAVDLKHMCIKHHIFRGQLKSQMIKDLIERDVNDA